MTTFIDFENVEEVKDFMLKTLINKEQLLDQIAILNEEIKVEKKSSNRWMNLYLETRKENTSLKKELEQTRSRSNGELKKHEGKCSYKATGIALKKI